MLIDAFIFSNIVNNARCFIYLRFLVINLSLCKRFKVGHNKIVYVDRILYEVNGSTAWFTAEIKHTADAALKIFFHERIKVFFFTRNQEGQC